VTELQLTLECFEMSENMDLAIPILPCRSVSATAEFYRRLGFEGGAHEFSQEYAIFKRGDIELHFFTHAELDPAQSWAGCYIRVGDVQSLYETSLASGLPDSGTPRIFRLEDKPWGLREFAVVDPDGNLLRIGQVICQETER
jgi:catechol 2,3-dioxygenase-like lactoylglutathione lyase family enzyme